MFKYNVVNKDFKAIVSLQGDMDVDVTEILQDEIAPSLSEFTDVELDFSNVSFVDSSGIGLLISLIQNLQELGRNVVITHLTPDVQQVFTLLQLPSILGNHVFQDFIKVGDV